MNHYTKNEIFSKFDQIRKGHTCLNKPACFGYRFVLVAMFFLELVTFHEETLNGKLHICVPNRLFALFELDFYASTCFTRTMTWKWHCFHSEVLQFPIRYFQLGNWNLIISEGKLGVLRRFIDTFPDNHIPFKKISMKVMVM